MGDLNLLYKDSEFEVVNNTTEQHFATFIDENAIENIQQVIMKNHKEYNESVIGPFIEKPFTLHVRDKNNKVIAGLFGVLAVNYDCLVQVASVDKRFRRQGIGRRMFQELERYAKSNGCKNIRLETSAFQAKRFYEKLGYVELASFEQGYFDHDIHIMQKVLHRSNLN